MTHFTFVTQSLDKLNEAERILGMKLDRYDLELPEIQSIDVEEVITYKAKYAYNALGRKPVMVEDTGLYIEAWNGLPGALIKWFIKSVGTTGICSMLHEFHDRRARAKTVVATYDGQLQIFPGEIHGRVASAPTGEGGFGWDKIFVPEGASRTFAEMSPSEKDSYSMRRLALEAMRARYEN
jgi:non-canonical purine NTP pyrophosphatase (RdgB/HAM1 family)